jgi:fused signal recognition particle receptor
MEEILISGDIGVDATIELIEKVRQKVKDLGVRDAEQIMELLKSAMLQAFNRDGKSQVKLTEQYFQPPQKPFVMMIVGVNGTGKTTTIGKLAARFRKYHQKVLISAADTFRAAASDQ